jgi:hypothetical protein
VKESLVVVVNHGRGEWKRPGGQLRQLQGVEKYKYLTC